MVQMMDDDELFTYAKEHSRTWVGSLVMSDHVGVCLTHSQPGSKYFRLLCVRRVRVVVVAVAVSVSVVFVVVVVVSIVRLPMIQGWRWWVEVHDARSLSFVCKKLMWCDSAGTPHSLPRQGRVSRIVSLGKEVPDPHRPNNSA